MRAIISHKKFWGLQMLTWVWLARAKHKLTKPKSTFRPQNFWSGLRVPHVQSFPFPTVAGPDGGQWAHSGQLLPGVSCPRGGAVAGGGCRVGSCRVGSCRVGSCRHILIWGHFMLKSIILISYPFNEKINRPVEGCSGILTSLNFQIK